MLEIFGPPTERVLAFLAGLNELSPAEITTVTDAWRDTDDRDRTEAWVRIYRDLAEGERLPVLTAASVARQAALEVAGRRRWRDWRFWAAASDACAGIAAGNRIGSHYVTLVSPAAAVMPWLPLGDGEAQTRDHVANAGRASGPLPQDAWLLVTPCPAGNRVAAVGACREIERCTDDAIQSGGVVEVLRAVEDGVPSDPKTQFSGSNIAEIHGPK